MSQNLDLVRSIYAEWERGDFGRADWADPEIEYVVVDGPEPGSWRGLRGMSESMRDALNAWKEYRVEADEFRELDAERVLVVFRAYGRGKISGLDLRDAVAVVAGVNVFRVRNGSVTRIDVYYDSDRALADLGPKG